MKLRIQHRLFFALLTASALAVVSMFFIMQWSINRGFLQYVNTIDQERLERFTEGLQDAYGAHGSWDFFRRDPEHWIRLLLHRLPDNDSDTGQPQRWDQGSLLSGLADVEPPPFRSWNCRPRRDHNFEIRLVVLDADKHQLIGPDTLPAKLNLLPLRVKDQVVGFLGLSPRQQLSDMRQRHFVEQQKFAMALVAAAILLISALFSLLLAKRLVRPIQALAAGARRLSDGDFSARVEAAATDELGQLARDFNTLALTLEKNERSRRQWVADISHELRTPLAILRGEIEAIQDGVRHANPEAIRSLHAEVLHLSRLVDDLYDLSLSDIGGLTYRKETLDPVSVLRQALDAFHAELAQRHISLREDLPQQLGCQIQADPQRLHQLFANLIDNACKYTDPGGRLSVTAERQGQALLFHIQDSAPGVPEQEMARLFERLYRVEGSRNRGLGGAGLGLAICRNIVEAHGGSIAAQTSPLGGVWITVHLPLL